MKTCGDCGESKPSSAFYHQRNVCKACLVKAQRKTRRGEDASWINELLMKWGRA